MKAAIVTGAGSGIGRAIARRLAKDGYGVIVNDLRAQAAAAVAKEIGSTAHAVSGDVSKEDDVARICEPGTRRVIQPRTIEVYPTVFHAVATVGGRLRKDITFCDVLKAMFPGGSITGAPKIRAMEIINQMEPTARGVYTGSIGFIGIDGSVCLNIAIRTIIIASQKAFVQTGGGIVADSDPQAEWDETITKARALLAGIRATQTGE